MREFEEKVAVVTGAGRGMGRATSLAFGAAGARVALVDITRDAIEELRTEIQSRGGEAEAFVCDVTKASEVQATVDAVIEKYGSVDILVNSAGILRTTTPLELITEEEWDQVLDVNLKGTFLFAKAVLPIMREQRYGKIINISSSAGRSTSELGGAHYTVSKTAVLGLTRHIAREYGAYGVNIVSLCPGLVDTPMIREQATPEKLDYWLHQIPLRRFASPEEAAGVVLFFASEAARYITGATIDFNGGSLLL